MALDVLTRVLSEQNMKSQLLLWSNLAKEMAGWCCTSATMDIKTVHRRSQHEGVSFLTITLPGFGKDFVKSLDQGYVDHSLFKGFAFRGGLPRFLGGFLDLVFDRTSGRLLDKPSIDAIQAIQQLTQLNGKILLECTRARERRALRNYVECEQDVRVADIMTSGLDRLAFKRISSYLFRNLFSNVQEDIYKGEIVPRHGPGSTADNTKANAKYDKLVWTERLEEVFPSGEFLLPNWNWRESDRYNSVDILEPGSELPAKVITVPKTLKTPRIIAKEPTCMQYVQQGLLQRFNEGIDRDDILSSFISCSSQLPNQQLAMEGSLLGNLATLDLSEASDRVSNQHVLDLLFNHPLLTQGVMACRSTKADVDGYGVQHLAKFASMGSALCFPFESMVFLTVIFLGIEKELNRPLTRKDISFFQGKVRVYGDDIIVPVEYVRSVVSCLEAFGFKVNKDKSFWTGKYRESCGKQYYDGHELPIVRVRRVFATQLRHVQEIISMVSLRNQFYKTGLWKTTGWLDKLIEKILKFFPRVHPSSSALGRHSFLDYQVDYVCPKLQAPLVRAYVVTGKPPSSCISGAGSLLKCLLKQGVLPFHDRHHLERAGRPYAVGIKRRSVSPF